MLKKRENRKRGLENQHEAWKKGHELGCIALKSLTHEQNVENGRKGGLATARRKKYMAALKEVIKALGNKKMSPKKVKPLMEAMGLPTDKQSVDEMTADMTLIMSMYREAIDNGNVMAAMFIRDTSGQSPKASVQIEAVNAKTADFARMSDEELLAAYEQYEQIAEGSGADGGIAGIGGGAGEAVGGGSGSAESEEGGA